MPSISTKAHPCSLNNIHSHPPDRGNQIVLEWLLAQDEEFVQRVIWTDEKLFVLHQKPHRKNDGKWSRENPHEFIESNDRNDQKS